MKLNKGDNWTMNAVVVVLLRNSLLRHSGWKSAKMSHFNFWHFPPIFGLFNELLSIFNVNFTRFARNVECDFFGDFQPLCLGRTTKEKEGDKNA